MATGAATFISAMFIVVSLGGRFIRSERTHASHFFLTPTVAHLSAVLFGCALAAAPSLSKRAAAGAFGVLGLLGLAYAARVASHVHRRKLEAVDHLGYGLAPLLGHGLLLAAAGSIAEGWPAGPGLLAAGFALLLLASMRNAWDLVIFFVERPDGPPPDLEAE